MVNDNEDETTFWEDDLEGWFQNLLDNNNYDGGTFGVVKNGRLVFAKGFGVLGKHHLKPASLMPISR